MTSERCASSSTAYGRTDQKSGCVSAAFDGTPAIMNHIRLRLDLVQLPDRTTYAKFESLW